MASAPNSDAFWAYRQSVGNQVRAYGTCVTEHEGKHYVVLNLKNVNGILAVYRVRNTGVLKGLKRWPQEIETMKVMPITNVDPHKPRK